MGMIWDLVVLGTKVYKWHISILKNFELIVPEHLVNCLNANALYQVYQV